MGGMYPFTPRQTSFAEGPITHQKKKDKLMNATITGSTITPDPLAAAPQILDTRCPFRFANGKRCRLPGLAAHSGFCLGHAHAKSVPASPNDADDLSSDLLPQPSNFSETGDIHVFLTRLLSQVTKGRISPRRAAVLAYITNQLLRSQRVIAQEIADQPQPIIFDLPRPKRD